MTSSARTTTLPAPTYTGWWRILAALVVLWALGCDALPPSAGAQERVVLRATNPAGVPLHPEAESSALSGRIPDRTRVEVVRWSSDRRWLEVRAIDGTRGWVTARYVAPDGTQPGRLDPWSSRQACLAALRGVAPRDRGRARIASWNLRWFPDGSSGGPSGNATDIEWVACSIATMRADVVALQEIRLNDRGMAAIATLARRLGELAGGRWEARFDRCPRDGRQHVGWLVDTSRARIVSERQLDSINPRGGCTDSLRPGHAISLRFAGGLDLSAIVVHLDSGQAPRDHAHRQESFTAIGAAVRDEQRVSRDDDVLVIGDLNTMGCHDCSERVEAAQELAVLDAIAGLRRVQPTAACTELYRGEGALLDHALVTTSTRELASDARAEVHGPCAQHQCRIPRGAHVPMLEHLSDHCPFVIELEARDLD